MRPELPTDLNFTIEDAEDVAGMHGRIRLQRHDYSGRRDSQLLRPSAWMDFERRKLQAYEYLCHIGEAKEWIESCIGEELPPIVTLDERLRDGVILAKLIRHFEPDCVPKIFEAPKLQFRHSDNANRVFRGIRQIGLPESFIFELTDLYDKKNIPKVIYCIHALSHLLARRNRAPNIKNLVGKLEFTDAELLETQKELALSKIAMPAFNNIGNQLARELKEPIPETEPELSEEEGWEQQWKAHTDQLVMLQALSRGYLVRQQELHRHNQLKQHEMQFIHLQSLARGHLARVQQSRQQEALRQQTGHVEQLQALARGHLAREQAKARQRAWRQCEPMVVQLQSLARAQAARQATDARRGDLRQHEELAIRVQAMARGLLARARCEQLRRQREKEAAAAIKIQAVMRGALVRKAQREQEEHYICHVDKVVKIQSLFRAKMANRAYRNLTFGENPPLHTMKNFVHLLDDSEQDFEEELELERLRQQAIKKIRENQQTEVILNDLDVKIALLVRNRISLEEVIKASKRHYKIENDAQLASRMLGSLDKTSRQRLSSYQELFYLLQTQSSYLGQLLFIMNQRGTNEWSKKFIETVVLSLFGFAQNQREEYLLLKLFQTAIKIEIDSINEVSEFLRGNPVFIKLAMHYYRGAKERKYLRDLLQPLIREVVENPELDLESDPLVIYRSLIREEESRTGVRSQRPYDVQREDALTDAETRATLIRHLQQLRDHTERFINRIHASLNTMPFGIRLIARELKEALMHKFPNERETSIMKIVGHLVYYRYINPAIIAPESFDVIEMMISPLQRKNLAEIAKMLNQVSMGKMFADDNLFLQPLNNYVAFTSEKFAQYSLAVTQVQDPETFFSMDEFQDLTNTTKPTIFISEDELYSIHEMLEMHLDVLAPEVHDPLREILQELGHPPAHEDVSHGNEIVLELTPRVMHLSDGESDIKHLFFETKRYLLYIIRIQSGRTLLDILDRPVTQWEEQQYMQLRLKESSRKAAMSRPSTNRNSLMNITGVSFAALKQLARQNLEKLGTLGKVSRDNDYQDMVNAIATDIRNKHRRRVQRGEELRKIRDTQLHLQEKAQYLEEQKQSYLDYINACMAQLTTKSKKARPFPFTRQYFHLKDLERTGRVPKFGSYMYTADRLYQKGVLISIDQHSPKHYDRITLTISSDEPGIFTIVASMMGVKLPGGEMTLRLEDLLQAQFNNVPVLALFDGACKVNVNLLVFLINKKFYS
ncbi:hypothetical protein SYNPS1DRAFT_26408 [Syncephalis pseudoplumigaleata]|uniref:Ras GTPase-activating-like protein IQGAP1 n=1 Tax=Syncephalis pseudoplumigaleata TaxID=1712513 RepID=A0A4P9Z6A4_9FUNG|nr:hypothetical protein SYNPS1DRAFT_26408 [Syncephalis pseudoplumigaleata]|eukprot:RKP27978.1 hypothetical protein SYNPS1DRAFT_26408 [Syncephalis pseudoplumigaleata]